MGKVLVVELGIVRLRRRLSGNEEGRKLGAATLGRRTDTFTFFNVNKTRALKSTASVVSSRIWRAKTKAFAGKRTCEMRSLFD